MRARRYLRTTDLRAFLSDHLGAPDDESSNLILRVVDDTYWPFADARVVPAGVAAVDLVDLNDVRSASEVLRRG